MALESSPGLRPPPVGWRPPTGKPASYCRLARRRRIARLNDAKFGKSPPPFATVWIASAAARQKNRPRLRDCSTQPSAVHAQVAGRIAERTPTSRRQGGRSRHLSLGIGCSPLHSQNQGLVFLPAKSIAQVSGAIVFVQDMKAAHRRILPQNAVGAAMPRCASGTAAEKIFIFEAKIALTITLP